MKKYIIALDAGTTSNRAIIFDSNGDIAAVSQKELRQYYPKPGWVEHNADEIWTDMLFVMRDALKRSGLSARDIAAIGIANQRETTVLWDRHTGRPIYNAVVWQSRQSAAISEKLKKQGLEGEFRYKTGLPIDAYFSATKIAWILDNIPYAREYAESGSLLFGTIDSWLIWKLTGGRAHVTDCSNASRTMIYNIRTVEWDDALLGYLNIPRSILPELKPSSYIYGKTNLLGDPIPVAGALGDQQAALFGQGCTSPGMAKNTYGTGCFLLMNTGDCIFESQNGLASTIAWGIGGKVQYALEGAVFVAGAAVQWLRDEMKIIASSADSERVAQTVSDTGGVYFVPAFTGLGSPYWDESARGMMIGITRGTSREHMVRSVLESIAYQTKDVLNAAQADTGISLCALNVDGGAAANNLLMQFQADILGVPVTRAANLETTALGAACAAALAVGCGKTGANTFSLCKNGKTYTPQMERSRAEKLYKGWQRAVKHAENWLLEE